MIHTQPYRKDSGIEITVEEPYLVKPNRHQRKFRNKVRSGQYLQTIVEEYDEVRHKPVKQKRIIHNKF